MYLLADVPKGAAKQNNDCSSGKRSVTCTPHGGAKLQGKTYLDLLFGCLFYHGMEPSGAMHPQWTERPSVDIGWLGQRTSSTAANVAFLASSIRSFLSSSSVSVAAPTCMAPSMLRTPSTES